MITSKSIDSALGSKHANVLFDTYFNELKKSIAI